MQHVLSILFLLVSACGATIIVSKGDIFKPLRLCVERSSKTNYRFIHDITIDGGQVIASIFIDGNKYILNDTEISDTDSFDYRNFFLGSDFLDDIISCEVKREGFAYRILLVCEKKHEIFINTSGFFESKMNAYEKFDHIKIIQFISDMISCPQCCAVWVGIIWYALYLLGAMNNVLFMALCFGCVVSLFSYLYFKVYTKLEK